MSELGNKSAKYLILLASFNGADYIREQIESIRSQSEQDWILLIRDDGSTDDTTRIINELAAEEQRIHIIHETRNRSGSAKANFFHLLQHAIKYSAQIYLFSDQDDIWAANKLEKMGNCVTQMADEWNSKPILLHSDLAVVDDYGRLIAASFFDYQGLTPTISAPHKTLLVQNFVTGCASAFNRQLLRASLPYRDGIIIHDWWMALVASVVGEVRVIDEPLVLYRQHNNNQIGAKGKRSGMNPFKKYLYVNFFKAPSAWNSVCKQIGILMAHREIKQKDSELIRMLNNFKSARHLNRVYWALRIGMVKQHWILTAYMYFLMLFLREVDND